MSSIPSVSGIDPFAYIDDLIQQTLPPIYVPEETSEASTLVCYEILDVATPEKLSLELFEYIRLGQICEIQSLISLHPEILLPPLNRNREGVPHLVYSLQQKQFEAATILIEAFKDKPYLLMDRGAYSRTSVTFEKAAEYLPPCALDLTQELRLDELSNDIFAALHKSPKDLLDSMSSIEFSSDRKFAIEAYMSTIRDTTNATERSNAIATLLLRLVQKNAIEDSLHLFTLGGRYIFNTTLWQLLFNLTSAGKDARPIHKIVEKAITDKHIHHDFGAKYFYSFLKNGYPLSSLIYYNQSKNSESLKKQIREQYVKENSTTSGKIDLFIWKEMANSILGAQVAAPHLFKCLEGKLSLLLLADEEGMTVFDINKTALWKFMGLPDPSTISL